MDYNILIADDVEMNRRLITDVLKGKLTGVSFYRHQTVRKFFLYWKK